MELLLIHQNHPGQFRDLTPALERRGHRVLGLGASPRGQRLDYAWQAPALPAGLVDPLLETNLHRAARVQGRCLQLREQGYRPDAVIAHSGWGELLYLADIWPEAVLIAYPELYATPLLLGYGFDADLGEPSPALRAQWRRGNLMGLAAVADADACVVPTRFARDTFPPPPPQPFPRAARRHRPAHHHRDHQPAAAGRHHPGEGRSGDHLRQPQP